MKKEPDKKHYHHTLRHIAFFGVIIFVILAFLISSSDKSEETRLQEQQPTVVKPAVTPEPEKELSEEEPTEPEVIAPVEEPIIEEPGIEEEIIEEPTIEKPLETLSDAKCEDGYISVTLTNTFDETFSVNGLTWWISGRLSRNIQCDKAILAPGESTVCPKLNTYKLGGQRRVTVYIFKKPYSVVVDCGKYTGS